MRPEIRYTPRLTDAERNLLALPGRLKHLDAFARLVVVPAFVRMLERHWETKGWAFGQPWADWAPSTLMQRIKKGNAALGILFDTGHLFRAIFRAVFKMNAVERTPTGVRVAFNLGDVDDPTVRFHFFGTRFMPARKPVPSPLPRSFRDEVRGLFRDFILTGRTRGAGGQFVSPSLTGAPR
jgi:hypothetical protein